MKNKFRTIAFVCLMLVASISCAGITFIPGTVEYNPVPIPTQDVKVPMLSIRSTGLDGVFKLDCSEVAECQTANNGCADIPFSQQLELFIDRRTGNVEGRTRGRLNFVRTIEFVAKLRGDATCLPFDGRACGQLVVDLEVRGPLIDPANPASVGQIRMQILGSLIRDRESARWAALSANSTLGFALPDDVAELLSCY
jgi:hypothetical protein